MAILETEMVAIDEIFFPYVVQNGRTLYQAFRENQRMLSENNT